MNLAAVGQKPQLKVIFLLFVLLFLDLIRLLGYGLSVEFLFLGVILTALTQKLIVAVTLGLMFGYLKDCLGPATAPFCLIEFPLLCLFAAYSLSCFTFAHSRREKLFYEFGLVVLLVIVHISLNSFKQSLFLPFFSLNFLIQSLVIYFFLNYFLKGWIPPVQNA